MTAGSGGSGSGGGGTFAMVAGGGTAGHVLPALAVAQALVDLGHRASSIHFVGSRRGIESRLVTPAGFEVTLLPGRGVVRHLAVENLGAVVGLSRAMVKAMALVARRRPAVVLSMGGYAGLPCALAAVFLRVPLVVAESNAVPGAANRLVARLARAAAVAFEGTALPRAVVTGNPVSPEVRAVDRSPAGQAAARGRLGLLEDRMVVAVFGGSLGARRINQAALGLARGWADRGDLAIYHVVGRRDWPEVSRDLPRAPGGGLVYQGVEYEDHMAHVLAAADVVVCRSGATSVAELAVTGAPSVLVPLPGAPGDHQTANAKAMVDAGGAVLLADEECTPERLGEVLGNLLARPDQLVAMGRAARSLGRPDAALAVARLVESHARVRPPVGDQPRGDQPARAGSPRRLSGWWAGRARRRLGR